MEQSHGLTCLEVYASGPFLGPNNVEAHLILQPQVISNSRL